MVHPGRTGLTEVFYPDLSTPATCDPRLADIPSTANAGRMRPVVVACHCTGC